MNKNKIYLTLALMFAFALPALAQTIGDTRTNTNTERPEVYDGRRWQEDYSVQINSEWSEITTAQTDLVPNDYVLDSSAGTFAITLEETKGEWEFANPNGSLGVNTVDVGTATQNFTDSTGATVVGPFTLDVELAHFKIVNLDGSNNFEVIQELAPDANPKWSTVSGANPALPPNNYILDSSGGTFAVVPEEVQGEWEFGNPNGSLGTNTINIGTASQTFTNSLGVAVAGPFLADVANGHFKIANIDGSSNFLVVEELDGTSSVFSTPDANGKVAVFNGDIDVVGTIDPDGMEFNDQGNYTDVATAQAYFTGKGVDFTKTIWVNPADGELYRGGDVVGSGEAFSFVETRCYEESPTPLTLDNDAFQDEINSTQLATLPAGAHMRWTATSTTTLDTLEVNGFNGTVTISWLTSAGDSGSQSVTFAGAVNPELLNLGGVVVPAGGYIDFTLDSISAGQMQLSPSSTSIANGWTALQDYSGFANTSHWATRLLGNTGGEHTVNVYEDDAGVTSYAEVNGENLTPLASIPPTWTLCVDAVEPQTVVAEGATGIYQIGDRHEQLTPITNLGAGTSIVTGHDLTQATGMTLKVKYQDTNSAHSWTQVDIDVDEMIARYNANEAQDSSDILFDDDFVTADIVDPATGEIAFTWVGRAFSYVWSELWAKAQTRAFHRTKLVLATDTALTTATATQLPFDTVEYDVGGLADIANNQVVIQNDGFYEIDSSLFHISSNRVAQLFIQVNGNNVDRDINAISNGDQVVSYSPKASTKMELSAGDIVSVVYYSNTASTTTGGFTQLTVTELPTHTGISTSSSATPVDDAIEVRLDGAFTLPTAVDGEVHNFSVEALPVSIDTTGGEPIRGDIDFGQYVVGDQITALPQNIDVLSATGTPISVTQPDNTPNTVNLVLVAGVVELTRGANGGLLNSVTQSGSNGGQVIIDDVEWFYNQGGVELPIQPTSLNDTTTPTTTSMRTAFDAAIGDEILGTNSWIRIISTGQIFELDFTSWQAGGGGGFAVTATEMTESPVLGWNVRKTSGEFISSDANNALERRADGLYVLDTKATEVTVLSSFVGVNERVETVSLNGVPFLAMADNEPTFTSYLSAETITPRDVSGDVYIDFTIKRATSPQPDSTFRQTSNFTAYFQQLTFNAETGVASVSSGGSNPDPEIILADVGTEFIRYVVRFTEMPGSFTENFRFRPAGDALGSDVGTIYFTMDGFKATTENPVVVEQVIGTTYPIVRTDALTGLEPTTGEVQTPLEKDTALIKLTSGVEEVWLYDGTAWSLSYTNKASNLPSELGTFASNNIDLEAEKHIYVDGTSGATAGDTVTLPSGVVGDSGTFYNASGVALTLAKQTVDNYLGIPSNNIPDNSGFSWKFVAPNTIEVVGTVDEIEPLAVFKATKTVDQSVPNSTNTKLTGWNVTQDTASAFLNDDFVAPATAEYFINAAVRLDLPNFSALNSEHFISVMVDGVEVIREGISISGNTFINGDDFLYGSISSPLTLTQGQVVNIEVRHGTNQVANVNPVPSLTFWNINQLSTEAVINTTDIAVDNTSVTAGDLLKWDGAQYTPTPQRWYTVNDLGASTGVVNVDFTDADNVKMTLTGDVTLTMVNPPITAGLVRVHVVQDATGGHVITFPANVLGDFSVLNTSANSQSVIMLYFDGVNYHG